MNKPRATKQFFCDGQALIATLEQKAEGWHLTIRRRAGVYPTREQAIAALNGQEGDL
jgi:hypothetical protein